ncbi:MAG: DsbA family protein [Myxococcota bacterium]
MRHLPLLLVSFTATLAVSCSNNGRGQPAQLPQASGKEAPLEQPVAANRLRNFPAVDLEGLDPAAMEVFAAIANEEICPCDCPRSFGACLQTGTRCEPAVLLGNWLAAQLRNGVAPEQLAEQITQEIAGGFAARPKELQLDGYATKGAPDAPFTIVEYADFECPHCKLASAVVGQLVQANPGKVRVVYKHFPLSFHVMAKVAAAAAEAAGLQGRFWEMHDAIFATQNMLDEDLIRGHAKAIGLDVERFEKDWKDPAVVNRVDASRQEGEALGITATPAFFVNGRPFQLMRTAEAFSLRLQMEEARTNSSCE